MKNICNVILLMLLFFIFTPGSQAQTVDHSRNKAIDFEPYAGIEQKHDDNIFLETKDKAKADWITTVMLGGEFQMPLMTDKREDSLLKIRYDADIIEFWNRRKLDRVDHTVSGSADLPFTDDLMLRLDEYFNKTSDPPNEELRGLHKRYYNDFNGTLRYRTDDKFGIKIGIEAAYQNTRDYYYKLKYNNNSNHMITGRVLYNIAPKLDVFGRFDWSTRLYDKSRNDNSRSNRWQLGLEGEIVKERLRGIIEGGYNNTEYMKTTDELNEFVMNVDLSYDLQKRTILDLFYERKTLDSTVYYESYYELNKMGVGVRHELLKRLSLSAGMSYQNDRYPYPISGNRADSKRRDNIWHSNVGLSYELIKEWVFVEMDYEYRQVNSNYNAYDYKNNRISARAFVEF